MSTGTGRGHRRILCVLGIGEYPNKRENETAKQSVFACGAPHALLVSFLTMKNLRYSLRIPKKINFANSAKILRSYK